MVYFLVLDILNDLLRGEAVGNAVLLLLVLLEINVLHHERAEAGTHGNRARNDRHQLLRVRIGLNQLAASHGVQGRNVDQGTVQGTVLIVGSSDVCGQTAGQVLGPDTARQGRSKGRSERSHQLGSTNDGSNVLLGNYSSHSDLGSNGGHTTSSTDNGLSNDNKEIGRVGVTGRDHEADTDGVDNNTDPDEGAESVEALHEESSTELEDQVRELVTTLEQEGRREANIARNDQVQGVVLPIHRGHDGHDKSNDQATKGSAVAPDLHRHDGAVRELDFPDDQQEQEDDSTDEHGQDFGVAPVSLKGAGQNHGQQSQGHAKGDQQGTNGIKLVQQPADGAARHLLARVLEPALALALQGPERSQDSDGANKGDKADDKIDVAPIEVGVNADVGQRVYKRVGDKDHGSGGEIPQSKDDTTVDEKSRVFLKKKECVKKS